MKKDEPIIEGTVGEGNGARRVYLVEVSDIRADNPYRRFFIEVNANTPSVAHRLAMRAGYAFPSVKKINRNNTII